MNATDTLWIDCHICGKQVARERVAQDAVLPPWKVIRFYEKAITHVRREHSKKAAA